MASRIVSLTAQVGMDGRGFQRGLDSLGSKAGDFANNLKRQLGGAFSAAAIAFEFQKLAQAIGRIKDLSEQTRLSTDEVQRLDIAAKQSGQTFEDMSAKLEKIGDARKDAAEGNEAMRRNFAKFGITLADLNNPMVRNIDLLTKLGAAMNGMVMNPADQAALRDLLGKGSERIAAILRDFEKVKFVPIDQAAIESIDQATKALERLKAELQAIAAGGLGDVIGAGQTSMPDRIKRMAKVLLNPTGANLGSILGKQAALRLDAWFNPAGPGNPKARSAEPVGPEMPGGPALFDDKGAQKLRLEILKQEETIREKILQLQFNAASIEEKRAMLEEKIKYHLQGAADASEFGMDKLANEERLKALEAQGQLDLLKSPGKQRDFTPNLTPFQQVGADSGLSTSRAFALRNPEANDARKTANGVEQAVRKLTSIDDKIKNPAAGNALFK